MPYMHIDNRDSFLDESLFNLWSFLNNTYPLYKQLYKPFYSDILYSDGNYVICRDGKIIFFMNYFSDGLHNLVVNLMAGNSREAIMFALGLSIYEVIRNGHDGLVYHVNSENSNMLDITTHGGIPEVKPLRAGLRSFKCSTTYLIRRFGHFYHRFLLTAPSLNIEFFRHIQHHIYIARGWKDISKRSFIYIGDGEHVIYLKSKHISIHGTADLLPHLYESAESDGISTELKDYLQENNCSSDVFKAEKEPYRPIDAIILPTSGCNLGCKYCYSEATPKKKNLLEVKKGLAGIDFIYTNAQKRKYNHVHFSFLGGGEPLVAVDLDCLLVDHIRKKEKETGIKANISICTNGTIYNERVKYLLREADRVQFSLDGTSDVQNYHRPFANGGDSFQSIESNIKAIRQEFPKIRMTVRATVSNYSVEKMPDFVRYLSQLGVDSVAFEPLMVTGRALVNTKLTMPDLNQFVKYFIEAEGVGVETGVEVSCSATSVYRRTTFCGATNNNFVITPDGNISTCVEVSSVDDPLSKYYIIGNICDEGVVINEKKLDAIRQFDEGNRVECVNCIAEKSCRGNCPVRTMRMGSNGTYYINELCIMQTKLLLNKVKNLHKKKEEIDNT